MNRKRRYPRLKNPPIREALLDIRAKLPEATALDDLARFQEQVKDRYPQTRERVSFQGGIQVVEGRPVTMPPSGGPDGYLFESPNENKIVQARLDGFTFNKLRPYESWKAFQEEARELWDLYRAIANPERITRVALRYINRIEVPLPIGDFKEYIRTVPEIAPTLPQGLSHFFMRLLIPNDEIDAVATVTETMEPATSDQRLPIIFDIDVWKITDYPPDSTAPWKDFEKLRTFKNRVFFESITDKTRRMFNGLRVS